MRYKFSNDAKKSVYHCFLCKLQRPIDRQHTVTLFSGFSNYGLMEGSAVVWSHRISCRFMNGIWGATDVVFAVRSVYFTEQQVSLSRRLPVRSFPSLDLGRFSWRPKCFPFSGQINIFFSQRCSPLNEEFMSSLVRNNRACRFDWFKV